MWECISVIYSKVDWYINPNILDSLHLTLPWGFYYFHNAAFVIRKKMLRRAQTSKQIDASIHFNALLGPHSGQLFKMKFPGFSLLSCIIQVFLGFILGFYWSDPPPPQASASYMKNPTVGLKKVLRPLEYVHRWCQQNSVSMPNTACKHFPLWWFIRISLRVTESDLLLFHCCYDKQVRPIWIQCPKLPLEF